jgi:phosphomannomutase
MTDQVCFAYTLGFIQYLESTGEFHERGSHVAVAGDLRSSTDRIMKAVCAAILEKGYTPLNCGKIPSPAVAYYGLKYKVPAIMVTGSHIPDDRNGIKFNKISGEILKSDEQGIKSQIVCLPEGIFDTSGGLNTDYLLSLPPINEEAESDYLKRYTDFFPPDFLQEKRIGFYQHSAVGRNMLPALLEQLGAQVTIFGHSEDFVPVDTEAIRPQDTQLAVEMARKYKFDALYSTDGDSDRPLVADEKGNWLRGDIAGILVSEFLGADSVAAPVSCNTALEKCGKFKNIRRTKIGSPYVIEAMIAASNEGYETVTGYEANGGFLTNTWISNERGALRPLPTRDTAIVFLGIMGLSIRRGKPVSELVRDLPFRYTASGRLKAFPTERSREVLELFNTSSLESDMLEMEKAFGTLCGKVMSIDKTDGVRIFFENSEIIHLRPSGNAPEFRCYTEAASDSRAIKLKEQCLEIMEKWRHSI